MVIRGPDRHRKGWGWVGVVSLGAGGALAVY